MKNAPAQRSLSAALIGRTFVHPVFDYLLIGGGLSLVVTVLVLQSRTYEIVDPAILPVLFLASNMAHFASSTVRLYTKPGTRSALPFVSLVFPLVALGALSLCIANPGSIGTHLQALYLTWSPYHYAAQAYGLAVMYSYRSGCQLVAGDKKLLWWVAMLPFFFTFARGDSGSGVTWILPAGLVSASATQGVLEVFKTLVLIAGYAAPAVLFLKVLRSGSGPMPLIALLILFTNAIWWFVLPGIQAFFWATIFHGVQYLAIVIIFHLEEQLARPENRRGRVYHTLWFYGASLLLGYGLFNCLPLAYVLAGFGAVESMLLVVAAINVHHFIVDQFIWRLKPGDSNRRVVEGALPTPA